MLGFALHAYLLSYAIRFVFFCVWNDPQLGKLLVGMSFYFLLFSFSAVFNPNEKIFLHFFGLVGRINFMNFILYNGITGERIRFLCIRSSIARELSSTTGSRAVGSNFFYLSFFFFDNFFFLANLQNGQWTSMTLLPCQWNNNCI